MEPSKDFRACSVYPTYAEVVGNVVAPLSENIVDKPFKNVQQYLETHFWLMREEVVGPLRKVVSQLKIKRNDEDSPSYMTAKFLRPVDTSVKKLGVKLRFTDSRISNGETVKEKSSQILKFGSLVCFTCNLFKTLIFATISHRQENYFKESVVFVKLTSECKEDIYKNEYMMIESETFFGAYEQVLKTLQLADDNDFPFPQYFIKVSKSDALPKYMRNGIKTISIKGVDQDFNSVRLLEPNSWPTAAEIGLDESQLFSLQAALTRELAFILGPPGTGKTYVGLTVAQILIGNKAALNLKRPILVISSTNHSLDRFLLGLLNFTDNIVRIGQQSKFSQLNLYNYNKLKGSWYYRLAYQDVIGMTASRASDWRPKLNSLGCEVVIVEDAAVVFDAQMFACLPNNYQHLIMIGGLKQLELKLENPDLASFKLNVSFFKRMLDNRESQKPLRFQYRMPPEMTKLISPLIYPKMEHGASATSLPALKLLTKRVSFVTHNFPESPEEIEVRTPEQIMKKQWKTGNSKKNDQEASFVVALCKYLLLQKVAPLDITILTTYAYQLDLIKKLIKEEKSKVKGLLVTVEVTTVDNFQGGENKFIILSLVRSNSGGALGFLEKENRIGVALSKAQNALIIVGNIQTLTKSCPTWKSIESSLKEQNALNGFLEFRCTTYPTKTHAVAFDEELIKSEWICSKNSCEKPHQAPALTAPSCSPVKHNPHQKPGEYPQKSLTEQTPMLVGSDSSAKNSVKDSNASGYSTLSSQKIKSSEQFPLMIKTNMPKFPVISMPVKIRFNGDTIPSNQSKCYASSGSSVSGSTNSYAARCKVVKSYGHKCSVVCPPGKAHNSSHETCEICNEPATNSFSMNSHTNQNGKNLKNRIQPPPPAPLVAASTRQPIVKQPQPQVVAQELLEKPLPPPLPEINFFPVIPTPVKRVSFNDIATPSNQSSGSRVSGITFSYAERCYGVNSCGHKCKVVCPPVEAHNSSHEIWERCIEPCLRMCKAGLHRCKLPCYRQCHPDCFEIRTLTNSCGRHSKDVLCKDWKSASGVCKAVCNRPMWCGHLCTKNCHQNDCNTRCLRCRLAVLFCGCTRQKRISQC
ncbi:NFX1-type zinc finger-containing protein 1-like [Cloeon dipterum]|uniref:NFX1-type zinc finger-containing protein 1-like n=1 Tax=Cloeon dipterum TaxID=197152 RepID=UPI0032205E42